MNIYLLEHERYSQNALDIYKKLGKITLSTNDLDNFNDINLNCDVLITRLAYYISKKFIKNNPRLKFIISPTTGLNHIDLDYANKNNIEIIHLNTKTDFDFLNNITSTAEHTWALLLSFHRKLFQASFSISKSWNRNEFISSQLKNKVLGIVGFGRIGSMLSNYALAFEMNVLFCDPKINKSINKVSKVDINYLAENSDIVSVNCDYNENSKNLINKNFFNKMKKDSFIINTSRGEVINEDDLIDALKENKIRGACLDVISNEKDSNLFQKKIIQYSLNNNNLIITPHIGGACIDAMQATEEFIAKKFFNTISGE
jgi:D-3-phosphoglycerate dehydrogenase